MAKKTIAFDELLKKLLYRSGKDTDSPTVADYPDVASMLNLRLQEIWDYPGGGWDFLKVTECVKFPTGMRVCGFGKSGADGFYEKQSALVNGKPEYINEAGHVLSWSSVAWTLYRNPSEDDETWYSSTEDVDTPDLVETWTDVTPGSDGLPLGTITVSAYKKLDISDGKQVLGVFNSDPREGRTAVRLRTDTWTGDQLRVQADAPDTVWWTYIPEAPDWIVDSEPPEVLRLFASAAIELTYADVLLESTGNKDGTASKAESKGYKRLDELCEKYAVMNTQCRMHVRR